MAFPLSCGGNTEVTIAMLEAKINALPIPCKKRKMISSVADIAIAQRIVAANKIMLPIRNIFFRPTISASLPKGTRNIAVEIRKDIIIQFWATAAIENSLPMVGNAMPTAEPIKGVKNEVTMVTPNTIFLLRTGLDDFIIKV
jgi:hypothetical protein